jgi:hypothetical protein
VLDLFVNAPVFAQCRGKVLQPAGVMRVGRVKPVELRMRDLNFEKGESEPAAVAVVFLKNWTGAYTHLQHAFDVPIRGFCAAA